MEISVRLPQINAEKGAQGWQSNSPSPQTSGHGTALSFFPHEKKKIPLLLQGQNSKDSHPPHQKARIKSINSCI